jgi:predicted porin
MWHLVLRSLIGSCHREISMKKSLIALSVMGTFVAAAAPLGAEVVISGAINIGPVFGSSDDGAAGATNDVSGAIATPATGQTGAFLHGTYSNVAIQSVEDLGNGNKILFRYQMDIGGPAGLFSTNAPIRNGQSHLGLSGNWGALKMGTNEGVYERFMYEADPLDNAAGVGGNLQILGTPGGQVIQTGFGTLSLQCVPSGLPGDGCVDFYWRSEHTIWYESPKHGGFDYQVEYMLPAFKGAFAPGTNPQRWAAGIKYTPERFPLSVDVAYEQRKDFFGLQAIAGNVNTATASGSTDRGIQVGGSYTFGDLSLRLRFERLTYELDGMAAGDVNDYERDAWWVAAKYNLATGYVGVEYGQALAADCKRVGTSCDARESGAQNLAAGYFHTLSKQTQAGIILSIMQNDAFANYVNIGGAGGIGQDSESLALYLKHTF